MIYSIFYFLLFLVMTGSVLLTLGGGRRLSHYGSRASLWISDVEYPITGPITDVGFPYPARAGWIDRLIHKRREGFRQGTRGYGEGINLSDSFPSLQNCDTILCTIVYDENDQVFRLEDTGEAALRLRRGEEDFSVKGSSELQNEDKIRFRIEDRERWHSVTFRMG